LTTETITGSEISPRTPSIARAMASGHESTSISLSSFLRAIVERQRMPLSCSTRTFGSTPHLRATESIRAVASLCDGQPPALPRFVKISKKPVLSSFIVTKREPQQVLALVVLPTMVLERGLDEGISTSGYMGLCAVVMTWFSRQPSL